MTVHRFFVAPNEMEGNRFPLPERIARQVRTVLRLGDGDRIVLLPNDGSQVTCRLEGGDCVVEERGVAPSEPSHRLTVAQALLKGEALEWVVRHGTEMGVARFQLVATERAVAREVSPRRLERLGAIAREAAEQSERGVVPDVEAPVPLTTLLGPAAVVLFERHRGARLGSLPPPSTLIIGPEGGFSASEIDLATSSGATLAGLGPRILRSETVAVAAAAVILTRTGDFA